MKRFVAFITLTCMILSCMPVVMAQTDNTEFVKVYEEAFEHPEKIGQSVSTLDNWSVDNENLDETTTGNTVKLAPAPNDAENIVMHVKSFREYSSNQYANFIPEGVVSTDYAIYTAKYKLPDVANDYVTYIKGNVTDSKGKTTAVNLTQLVLRAKGYFECIGTGIVSESVAIPRNKWFTLSVVYATKKQTFDMYLDGIKINALPINIHAYNANGAAITAINKVQLGIPRYSKVAADMYMDDVKILTLDGTVATKYDMQNITVPQSMENGTKLLTKGEYFASDILWKSSHENILNIVDGSVVLGDVTNDSEVTLTATISNSGTTIAKEFKTKVLSDAGRLSKITSNLNSNVISGQKYVKDNFTLNIPGLLDTDTITVTSSDSSVIEINGLNATVKRQTDDKTVDFTVTIKSKNNISISKQVKLYVISKGIEFYYDGIEYDNFENKQITGAGNWTVANENIDSSATGSTQKIKTLKEDSNDKILDIEVFRKYNGNNQVATLNQGFDIPGKFIVQMNLKFPGNENNRYIMYTTGTFVNENETKFYASTSQLYFYPSTGTILCETYKDASGKQVAVNTKPFGNDWFNLKLVYDNVNRYYDVYIDGIKQNTSPVYYARNVEGERVINQGNIRFGVHRDSGNPGHMYFDDLLVRAEDEEILNHELDTVRIPTTFVYDNPLPKVPNLFDDVELSWKSSDENIITSDGKVNRKIGFGDVSVNLTVTATRNGVSKSKDYPVKFINTPPYTIDNVVMETAGGSITYTPESGGKIKNISITQYENHQDAKAIIAVYGDKGLVSTSNAITVTGSATYDVNMDIPTAENVYVKAFVWDMSTLKPLSYSFRTANNLDEKISIFSMGDSTMQSYGDLWERQADGKMTGWMQVMPMGTDEDYIEIRNYGRSGKSTKSFTEEGYIFKVYEGMSVGDYLIIQFGHNDQKSNDSTTPYNYAPLEKRVASGEVPDKYKDAKTYEQWLREYVAAARMKGAYPVFATSIRRRQFDENGVVKNSHGGYPEAMIEVAKEINVPVIDLQAKTATWLNGLGLDNSLQYFCASYNGTDNTHLTYSGAVEVANLAIDAMKEIGLPVATYASTIE